MIQGNCLCGFIAFEAKEVEGMVFNCHCSRCRKSHGAAFSTQVICDKKSLKFLTGGTLLTKYESGPIVRAFCSNCGSRLMNYSKQGPEYLSISAAVVNHRTDLKPVGECFVLEKLGFIQLDNSIAHHVKLPEFEI